MASFDSAAFDTDAFDTESWSFDVTVVTVPAGGGHTGSGGGDGSWYWIQDLPPEERKRRGIRIRKIRIPGPEYDEELVEQILREDEELLLFVISAVKVGAI